MAKSNVIIENCGDETIIRAKAQFRIWRLVTILPMLIITWLVMGLFSLAILAGQLESWGHDPYPWNLFYTYAVFSIVSHWLMLVLFLSIFAKENVVINSQHVLYRFSLFGLGITRTYNSAEIAVQRIPESAIGHNLILRFFGLSKAWFRIRAQGKSRAIFRDINREAALKIAGELPLKDLMAK